MKIFPGCFQFVVETNFFTLDSYALIANTQCFGQYGTAYTSLVRAKTNCDLDPLCTMVADPHCEGYRYRTCRGSSGDSTRGSCVWIKNTGETHNL